MFHRVSVIEWSCVPAMHVANVYGFGAVHSKTDPDKRQDILSIRFLYKKPLICPGKWFFIFSDRSTGKKLISGGGDVYVEK